MTIDEEIVFERKLADYYKDNHLKNEAKEHEQRAEWLELLKWYEQGMEDIPSESGVLPKDVYHAGYNKAIDDFAEKLKRENKETIPTHSGYCRMSFDEVVDEIAEQIKAVK